MGLFFFLFKLITSGILLANILAMPSDTTAPAVKATVFSRVQSEWIHRTTAEKKYEREWDAKEEWKHHLGSGLVPQRYRFPFNILELCSKGLGFYLF